MRRKVGWKSGTKKDTQRQGASSIQPGQERRRKVSKRKGREGVNFQRCKGKKGKKGGHHRGATT